MRIKNKKGQSTVEYILLVTAVIAVMVVFAVSQNSPLQSQLNATLNSVSSQMNVMANHYMDSHK